MRLIIFRTAALAAVVCGPVFSASALIEKINAASLIVVGETADGGGTANNVLSFGVNIVRTLKGPVQGGGLTVHFARGPNGPGSAISGAAGRCGIFFLLQGADQWSLLPRSDPPFAFDDLFYPAGSCDAVKAPTSPTPSTDDIVAAVLQALQSGTPDDRYIVATFNSLNPGDSPAAAQAAAAMSSATQPGLQVLSIAWRLALGDDSTLGEVPARIQTLKQTWLGSILASPISGYGGTSAAALNGLGEIAIQGKGTGFELAASMALRSAHTRDALPYLLQLLDSADQRVRLFAIDGLSMFLLEVPPLSSGASPQDVLEKALNPTVRKKLGADDAAHIHFGGMNDAAGEAALIAWWKTRAQQMIAAGQ